MDLNSSILQFLHYLQFEKKYSNHTRTSYQTDLIQFENYISSTYNFQQISLISHVHIKSWLVKMINEEVKNSDNTFNGS
jgi:integrase/recombinase XerC